MSAHQNLPGDALALALFPLHFTIKLFTSHSLNRNLVSVLKPLKLVTKDFPKAQNLPDVSTAFGIEHYSNLEKLFPSILGE